MYTGLTEGHILSSGSVMIALRPLATTLAPHGLPRTFREPLHPVLSFIPVAIVVTEQLHALPLIPQQYTALPGDLGTYMIKGVYVEMAVWQVIQRADTSTSR